MIISNKLNLTIGDRGSRKYQFASVLIFSLSLYSPIHFAAVDDRNTYDDSRGFTNESIATGNQVKTMEQAPKTNQPFGYNLFTGGFSGDREIGLNPDYLITEGDQVTVRIWGATEINEILKVDAQGNVFIPRVGPVAVAGVRNADLSKRVERAVRTVFTNNVQIYTSLNNAQPLAVFVTGFVNNPGRYAGVASNSLLYYIDRAAGINTKTGSYRDIRIIRDGKLFAQADLYAFLHEGIIPTPQFKDGDTIVIGPRGNTVRVSGDVRNAFSFEIIKPNISGKELIAEVRPLPNVSHVQISGVRGGKPFSRYVPISDLDNMSFNDGDQIEFVADLRKNTIMVKVEGSFLGPSQLAVPLDATLQEVLNHIPVDPNLSDIKSISIRRESVAKRQKQTLENSLHRLENVYLTASSATDEEARIRTQEAKMISDFVKRARTVVPNGRLVVANAQADDLILEENDVITIPQKSKTILVSGEVLVPQAIVYQADKTYLDYIEHTGGFNEHADKEKVLIVRRNGEVLDATNNTIREGDEIMVLPDVPVKNLQVAKEIVDVIYKIAVSAAVTLGF